MRVSPFKYFIFLITQDLGLASLKVPLRDEQNLYIYVCGCGCGWVEYREKGVFEFVFYDINIQWISLCFTHNNNYNFSLYFIVENWDTCFHVDFLSQLCLRDTFLTNVFIFSALFNVPWADDGRSSVHPIRPATKLTKKHCKCRDVCILQQELLISRNLYFADL